MLPPFPDSPGFFRNVDSHRTPGNAAPASNASRCAKLIDPRTELVRHPLPVASLRGGSDGTAVDVRKTQREARIPTAPSLGVISGHVADIFDSRAETGRADHRAVSAGQTTPGNIVPARVVKALAEKILDPVGVDATHLLARSFLNCDLHLLQIFFAGRRYFQPSQYPCANFGSGFHKEAVSFGSEQFGKDQIESSGNSGAGSH